MDVSPHELRTIELREAWRGYRQDDVDELLDRVAGTIERLQAQVERLGERLAASEQEKGLGREADEMLRRTLLLAQRTADAAVSEAQERARRVLSESEAHAHSIVSGAEAEARRVALAERQRIDDEVRALARRRDALLGDIGSLEHAADDYRRRLRAFLEDELSQIEARRLPPSPPAPVLVADGIPDAGEAPLAPESAVAPEPVAPEPVAPEHPSNGGHRPTGAPDAFPERQAEAGAGVDSGSDSGSTAESSTPAWWDDAPSAAPGPPPDVDLRAGVPAHEPAPAPADAAREALQAFNQTAAAERAAERAAQQAAQGDPTGEQPVEAYAEDDTRDGITDGITGDTGSEHRGDEPADDLRWEEPRVADLLPRRRGRRRRPEETPDDQFFADLRRAVEDDAPLGPREESHDVAPPAWIPAHETDPGGDATGGDARDAEASADLPVEAYAAHGTTGFDDDTGEPSGRFRSAFRRRS